MDLTTVIHTAYWTDYFYIKRTFYH